MLRIVLAECRRLVRFLPFGVGLWLVVAVLVFRDFDRFGCCPTYGPDRLSVTSKLLFLTLGPGGRLRLVGRPAAAAALDTLNSAGASRAQWDGQRVCDRSPLRAAGPEPCGKALGGA